MRLEFEYSKAEEEGAIGGKCQTGEAKHRLQFYGDAPLSAGQFRLQMAEKSDKYFVDWDKKLLMIRRRHRFIMLK